jgi:hypothetical protein
MTDDERQAFIEQARADPANTRAEMEEIFAERQALFDSGKLRQVKPPEIKQRSFPGMIYKDRADALVVEPQQRTNDDAWNAWADSKIKNALGQFASEFAKLMGEEVAIAQNEQSARLRGEMSGLKTHLAVIAEGLTKLLERKK